MPFEDHLRKRPTHLAAIEQHNRSIIQFVTVCTDGRKPVLANEAVHDLLEYIWKDNSVYQVGRYVIMPDHIHLFCSPNTWPNEPLSKWVCYWKSRASTSLPLEHEGKLWQRDFWDRQLRSGESYGEKWNYVRNNPVRAGLVKYADDWPYQGEIYPFSWHD